MPCVALVSIFKLGSWDPTKIKVCGPLWMTLWKLWSASYFTAVHGGSLYPLDSRRLFIGGEFNFSYLKTSKLWHQNCFAGYFNELVGLVEAT